MRILIAVLSSCWLLASVPSATNDYSCVIDLLERYIVPQYSGLQSGFTFRIRTRSKEYWSWDPVSQSWETLVPTTLASGYNEVPMSQAISVWPRNIGIPNGYDCSSGGANASLVISALARYGVHEILHWVCPPHFGGPGLVEKTTTTPPSPPLGPEAQLNCNDLNYVMATANGLCSLIQAISECLGMPSCAGLEDEDGNVIPGLERANLAALCASLADDNMRLQNKYNTPDVASVAHKCTCIDGWTSFSIGCPAMYEGTGNCTSPAQTYPGNLVIPDCGSSCP